MPPCGNLRIVYISINDGEIIICIKQTLWFAIEQCLACSHMATVGRADDGVHNFTYINMKFNSSVFVFVPLCYINISWVYLCGARIDVPRSTIYVEQEWPCLFPIIIGLSVEISGNPTKHLAYFHFYGNPIQRLNYEKRESRSEKIFASLGHA